MVSYFTIQHQTTGWMLYFACGYCQHGCPSFKAAWKAGQTHIRRDHRGDGVKHAFARQRAAVTMYLDRDGRVLSRFP